MKRESVWGRNRFFRRKRSLRSHWCSRKQWIWRWGEITEVYGIDCTALTAPTRSRRSRSAVKSPVAVVSAPQARSGAAQRPAEQGCDSVRSWTAATTRGAEARFERTTAVEIPARCGGRGLQGQQRRQKNSASGGGTEELRGRRKSSGSGYRVVTLPSRVHHPPTPSSLPPPTPDPPPASSFVLL
jgi:hypothetical protein